jgi:hypothetical protein
MRTNFNPTAITASIKEMRLENRPWSQVANDLNTAGWTTQTGTTWTDANVRKWFGMNEWKTAPHDQVWKRGGYNDKGEFMSEGFTKVNWSENDTPWKDESKAANTLTTTAMIQELVKSNLSTETKLAAIEALTK